ncbi:MAG TPA: hypothetical protein ENK08_09435 [Chloroflexi bacterium]|nr:hypothetical protein [Chloroflexota bacterium]
MPAESRSQRTFWHALWEFATGDVALAAVLLALALCWVLLLLIPQAPPDPLGLGRWMIRAEARFGALTGPLRSLGLFTLLRSPFYRAILAMLAFLLLVRTVAWAERLWQGRRAGRGHGEWTRLDEGTLEEMARWLSRRGYRTRRVVKGHVLQADRWPWAELTALLANLAPLLLLLGLLVGEAAGWKVEGVVGEAGRTVSVPGDGVFTLVKTAAGWAADRPGVRVYPVGSGPELTVSAVDSAGNPLGLQQSASDSPSSILYFRLTEEERDAYFAIPDAGLIVRIAPRPETPFRPGMDLQVQVFRSPSGRLVWEGTASGEATTLAVEELDIHIAQGAYPLLLAVRDPGYWLKVLALALIGVAMLGWGFWPVRRLWLRVDQGQLVGAGDLPRVWRGKGGRAWQAVRAAAGAAAALASGSALYSLLRGGVLWRGSSLQIAFTVLAAVGIGMYLIFGGKERGRGQQADHHRSGRWDRLG